MLYFKFTLFIIINLLISNSLQSQLVREWKIIPDTFGGTNTNNSLAISQGKYLGALTTEKTLNSFDSVSVLVLSNDSSKTWFTGLRTKLWNTDSNYLPLPGDWIRKYFEYIEMPSNNLILLLGREDFKNGSENNPFLYRSTDFGKSWENMDIIKDISNVYINDVSMLDDNFGLLITLNIAPLKHDLYKTTEGGKSWSKLQTENTFDNQIIKELKCFSEDEYVVISQDSIFSTSDAGITWNKYPIPNGSEFSFSFNSKSLWFAAGTNKINNNNSCILYKTTNGGISWINLLDTIITTPNGLSDGFSAIDFYDENNGIIGVKRDVIIRTTDGGMNWQEEVMPNETFLEIISTIKFFGKEKVIASTQERMYLNTGNYTLKPPIVSKDSLGQLNYKVFWNRIEGGEYFKIQVSETTPPFPTYIPEDFYQKLIVDNDNLTDTVFNLNSQLKYGKHYHIHVKTYNDNMESDWSRMIFFKTPDDTITYPSLDTLLLIEPINDTTNLPLNIKFKWFKVNNSENYTLLVSQLQNYPGNPDFNIKNIKDTVYTLEPLLPNTSYIWWVIANAEGYSSSLSYYRVFTTGSGTDVQEITSNNYLSLYPNPTSDFITITIPELNNGLKPIVTDDKVQIFDVLGIEVMSIGTELDQSQQRIDVSHLPAGVYFVKVGGMVDRFVKM